MQEGDLFAVKKKLFNSTMKGKWDEVIKLYRADKRVHTENITRSDQTALHIAVSDGKENEVEQLVKIICEKAEKDSGTKSNDLPEALKIADDRGNTPLHIAATLGNVAMCYCIAKENSSLDLIGARNHDSETPFFLAALHGQKDAFLCLHSFIKEIDSSSEEHSRSHIRKNDGDTILHCAISGDHFDLAFQIIHLYKELVNSVNEQGISPLHLLAAKPSAFRSGSHFRRCKQMIYHCIFVEELKEDKTYINKSQMKTDGDIKCPENYHTCCDFISLIYKGLTMVVGRSKEKESEKESGKEKGSGDVENPQEKDIQLFPPNYKTTFEIVKLVSKAMLIILGLGSNEIRKIREKKQKHIWSVQLLDKLLEDASDYENDGTKPSEPLGEGAINPLEVIRSASDANQHSYKQETTMEPSMLNSVKNGSTAMQSIEEQFPKEIPDTDKCKEVPLSKRETPILISVKNGSTAVQNIIEQFPVEIHDTDQHKKVLLTVEDSKESTVMSKRETPVLIAAKNGITEIVQRVLDKFPVAIHDMNTDKKNIVLLAVENRQPHVYEFLHKTTTMKDSVFRKVDNKGNSALHLAATLGEHKPWLIPGAALQMQWELRWYEFVKDSMPFHFFVRYNKDSKTPKDVFTETHSDLVKAGGEWLTNTSKSCSVVAALIATVAFATSATVPGGVNENSGTPTLENQPAFKVFAISSLVALCFSVTAVVMFLSILTSRYQERDFAKDLPRKLLVGLTSLFVSIASMLISFCAGHFFVLKDNLKFAALPVYAVTCLPVTFFAIAQFPLYFDLAWATFKKVPQRSYKAIPV